MAGTDVNGLPSGKVRTTWRGRKETRGHKKSRYAMYRRQLHEILARQPPQKFIRRRRTSPSTAAGAQFMEFQAPLYSINGTINILDDITAIARATIQNNTGAPTGVLADNKFYFTSAHQKFTLSNTGSTAAYVYLYKYYVKKRLAATDMNALFTTVPLSWAGTTAVGTTTLGASPFDFKDVTEYVTIKSCQEMMVQPGEEFTAEISLGKNKTWDQEQINLNVANALVGLPGWTEGFLVRAHGIVGATDAEAIVLVTLTVNTYMGRVASEDIIATTAQQLP